MGAMVTAIAKRGLQGMLLAFSTTQMSSPGMGAV